MTTKFIQLTLEHNNIPVFVCPTHICFMHSIDDTIGTLINLGSYEIFVRESLTDITSKF